MKLEEWFDKNKKIIFDITLKVILKILFKIFFDICLYWFLLFFFDIIFPDASYFGLWWIVNICIDQLQIHSKEPCYLWIHYAGQKIKKVKNRRFNDTKQKIYLLMRSHTLFLQLQELEKKVKLFQDSSANFSYWRFFCPRVI